MTIYGLDELELQLEHVVATKHDVRFLKYNFYSDACVTKSCLTINDSESG